jgi:hypothetical protein
MRENLETILGTYGDCFCMFKVTTDLEAVLEEPAGAAQLPTVFCCSTVLKAQTELNRTAASQLATCSCLPQVEREARGGREGLQLPTLWPEKRLPTPRVQVKE